MEEKVKKRYPGIRPFQDNEIDQSVFKGRKDEIQQLLHLILAEKLVVLFAKSGVGKSSLLNAGVFKLLREKDYFPIRIRLNDPGLELIDAIDSNVSEAVSKSSIEYTEGEKKSFWQFFKTAEFWSKKDVLLTPVIVFDQFEEIFTLGYSDVQRKLFFEQLADIIRGSVPKELIDSSNQEKDSYSETAPQVKVVISMREDFLAQLEEMATDIPSILRNRFRLKALTIEKAREAIEEPARLKNDNLATKQFTYDNKAVDTILNFLNKRESQSEAEYKTGKKLWPWKFLGMLLMWIFVSSLVIIGASDLLFTILIITNFFVIIISCSIFAFFKPIKFAVASLTTLFLYLFFLFYSLLISGELENVVWGYSGIDLEFVILLAILVVISCIPGLISWRRLKGIVKARTDLGALAAKEIEPFQLQLLCQHIEDKVLKKQMAATSAVQEIVVNEEDFGGEEGMDGFLQTFYSNQVKRVKAKYRRVVRKLCEKGLVSPTGRRLSLAEEIIADTYRIPIPVLGNLIDYRLLRAEPKLGTYYYEISHDTMIKPIVEIAKQRERKKISWSLFLSSVIIIFFIAANFVQQSQENKDLTNIAKFDSTYDALSLRFLADNMILNDNRATIRDKMDKLRSSIKVAHWQISSLRNLYSKISDLEGYYERMESINQQFQFLKDTLAGLETFSLYSTISEKEELIISDQFYNTYSYLTQISRNAEDMLNNDRITINEKIDGLLEYKVGSETKLQLLENLIRSYPQIAQKNKFNDSYLKIKEQDERYMNILIELENEFKRISNEYATITNSKNFLVCTNVDQKTLEPDGITNIFREGKIYVWANINAPQDEELKLEWLDSRGNLIADYYPSVKLSKGYRIYYYQNIKRPGDYEVRLFNSAGHLIGRQVFNVKPNQRQSL